MNEAKQSHLAEKAEKKEKRPAARRHIGRVLVWMTVSAIGLFFFVSGAFVFFLQSSPGEKWLAETINSSLSSLPNDMSGRIESFKGPIPSRFLLSNLTFSDDEGPWLEAESALIRMNFSTLPNAITIGEISLVRPIVHRMPRQAPSARPTESTENTSLQGIADSVKETFHSLPDWFPEIRIEKISLQEAILKEQAAGTLLPLSLLGSLSAGKERLSASLHITRDDSPCLPLTAEASLSSDLVLMMDMTGSDLGLLKSLPQPWAEQTALSFRIKGKGDISHFEASLNADLLDRADASENNSILSAAAGLTMGRSESSPFPEALASLSLESGPSAGKLWSMAGIHSGKLSSSFNASLLLKEEPELHISASSSLSSMEWKDPLLESLLGKACSLNLANVTRLQEKNILKAALNKLEFQSSHMKAGMEGTASLNKENLLSPDTTLALQMTMGLDDIKAVLPSASGSVAIAASLSGPMSALDTEISLSGDTLRLPGSVLQGTTLDLAMLQADIPHLLRTLPPLAETLDHLLGAESFSSEPITLPPDSQKIGRATIHAATRINGQPLEFHSLWNMEEYSGTSRQILHINGEDIHLSLGKNTLKGSISSSLPFIKTQEAAKQATILPIAPAIDGELLLQLSHWASIAHLTGQNISASPLAGRLAFSSEEAQRLQFQGNLNDIQIALAQGMLSLSGMKASLDIRNLWNPSGIDLHCGLKSISSPALSLSDVSAEIKGNAQNLEALLQSHGDIQGSAGLHWKSGECMLKSFHVKAPSIFPSLQGEITLLHPAYLRYGEGAISLSELSADIFSRGKLSLSGSYSDKIALSTSVKDLDLSLLKAFLQEAPSGTADLQLSLAGTPSRPTGKFKFNLNDIHFSGHSSSPVSLSMAGQITERKRQRVFSFSADLPEESKKSLGLKSFAFRGEIPLTSPSAGWTSPDRKSPLKGTINLAGDLGRLWKFAPLSEQKLSGQVEIQASLSGTLLSPQLSASVSAAGGRFIDMTQGVELKDINLSITADKVRLHGKHAQKIPFSLSAKDGRKGSIGISGWIDTENRLSLSGNINRLSPLHRQDLFLMLSGSFGAAGPLIAPHITADMLIDKGKVELANLPGSSIVTLPVETEEKAASSSSSSPGGTINARLRIPNQFFLRGYGLECEWKGDLNIQGSLAKPNIIGKMQAVRGKLDILGKMFTLSEGDISLNGGWPVSPLLNIVMAYAAPEITAEVTLSGTADKPEITLSSKPSLPQDEIISQVMFGQSSGTLSHVQALQLAAGAAQLAGMKNTDVFGMGRKILGVDVLRLNSSSAASGSDSSDMPETSLEMGTYILDNVYVGVEQGMGKESETDAVVEIELTPRIGVKAKNSSRRTEMSLDWKKNY